MLGTHIGVAYGYIKIYRGYRGKCKGYTTVIEGLHRDSCRLYKAYKDHGKEKGSYCLGLGLRVTLGGPPTQEQKLQRHFDRVGGRPKLYTQYHRPASSQPL